MKKILLIAALSVSCVMTKAQSITEYKASNGVTYHLKDTIKLGIGSGFDGRFVYVLPSLLNTSDGQRDWFRRKYTNGSVVLKAIETKTTNNTTIYRFEVGINALYNMYIPIEAAIQAHEIMPFSKTVAVASVADELLKLKSLLDSGGITQAEYDIQKKRILN